MMQPFNFQGDFMTLLEQAKIDFAYEEGCRTVRLAAPNTRSISQILKKGEKSSVQSSDTSVSSGSTLPARSGDELQPKEVKTLVGLAIDLSGSMATSIRNNTGGQISRLESFRQSVERLVNEARMRVQKAAPNNSIHQLTCSRMVSDFAP